MVSPINIFDQFSDTSEGRRIGFQTFLDNFRQRQPTDRPSQINTFNRPYFSNLQSQAENEFFGQAGQRIQADQSPQSFTDFLNDDFNLGRRARRAPTQQMGTGVSRFASPARFLFNQ